MLALWQGYGGRLLGRLLLQWQDADIAELDMVPMAEEADEAFFVV